MARRSKWVEISSPLEPVVDVARRAISDRLKLVWRYLRRASHGAPCDIENVHQLRVSTRRAMATLHIFENLLPRRRNKWMSRQLKRLRQTAGTARDLDVMLARFQALAADDSNEGDFAALVHLLKVRRQRAQDPIDTAFERLDRKRFSSRIKGLVKRVRLRTKEDRFDKPTFADSARTVLGQRVAEFFHAGDADFSDDAQLHAFRIQGKQLRYIMEVFAAAFEPAFREELYPQVAEMQELLGRVNDHATAQERFRSWSADEDFEPALRQTLDALVDEEATALAASRQEFLQWWTTERRDDLRRRFSISLQRLANLKSFDESPDEEPSAEAAAAQELTLRRAE